jgi:plastocyanin
MLMHRIAIVVALALAYSAPSQARASTVSVHIVNFDFTDTGIGGAHFDPTIHVGDTVEWVWDQGFHSTTSVSGLAESWDSSAMDASGQTFDHTFSNVGNFAYDCVIHGNDNGNGTASGMSGIVHVQAIAVPEPSSLMLGSVAAIISLAGTWRRSLRHQAGDVSNSRI